MGRNYLAHSSGDAINASPHSGFWGLSLCSAAIHVFRGITQDSTARTTLGDLHRATPWLWLHCEKCQHYAPRNRRRRIGVTWL